METLGQDWARDQDYSISGLRRGVEKRPLIKGQRAQAAKTQRR